MQGTLGTAKTWVLLRNLIDPNQSKATSSKTLQKILRQTPGTDAAIIQQLKDTYIGTGPKPTYIDYPHAEPSELDKDITPHEVTAALHRIVRNTAPGADGIQYRL